MAAQPVINEILASNSSGLVDGYNNHSDWIELYNKGDASLDLNGWHLTDDPTKPSKWTFPSRTLAAGQYMVVFASGKDTTDPAGNLHTNFSLSADGENVSLRQPDGTLVSEIAAGGANYPPQNADVSYGPSKILNSTPLLNTGAAAKAFVPTDGALDAGQWTAVNYSDSTWKSGTTGVGFDGGGSASAAGLLADWTADSLNALGNGASVASWNASSGTGTATQSTSANQPKLQKSQLNGHSVVHFDGSNDQLRITNQSLNGATNFTVAVVFRTSTAGHAGTQWYSNTGIVDAEVGGVTNDWGVTMNDAGSVGAGVGNPDTTLYSASGLNNGAAHIAVFTKNGTKTALSIDGGVPSYGTVSANARTVNQFVFGSINTNLYYYNGDIGEVRLYNAALSDDSARSLSSSLATSWGVTPAAGVYTPLIGLDLQSSMANLASTADIRIPFTVTNPSQYDTLTLGMKYDDGFVAYLNGTEVARRNAPGGAITYQSTATAARDDSAALTSESIDISPYVGLLNGSGTNILAIKALNVSATDSDLLVIPTLTAAISSSGLAYMTKPSPGAANNAGYGGLVSPVTFTKPHGYYAAPITTQLTTATPGATIVYTTDGSNPSLTNGTVVSPANSSSFAVANLTISATTVVRAAAFRTDYLPSDIVAESYFFTSDIIHQPEYTPNGAYWDVGLDTDVVNATQTYSVAQALTAIPTISLSLPDADMFGSNGIYANPEQKGDAWERASSVEYFDPNNVANTFDLNAGVQIEGGVSRDPSRPKKSFTLSFKGQYGSSKLNYPFFGNDAEQSFDHLVLRGGHSYSWANLGGEPVTQSEYLRDEFARDTQTAEGGVGSPGSFVQLYINGQYWGLYNAVEEVDQDFAAAHYGGTSDRYDIIKPDGNGGIYADSGSLDTWNTLFNSADTAYADGTVDSTEYANISKLVDTKALVDYMLDVFYRGDNDAPVLTGSTTSPRNFIALDNSVDGNGKVYFETWDGEISFTDVNYDRTEVFGNQNPGRLYQQLRTNSDFRTLVTDEVHRLFTGNGALTVAANQARYQALMNQINVAIVGESARWGNAKQTYVCTRDIDWVSETNYLLNTYMPQRSSVVLSQLTSDYPELNTLSATLLVNGTASTGATVTSSSQLTFSNGNASPTGTIYYTLDGTDPRAAGGGVASTALTYSGTAFTITQSKRVLARVLRNGTWSAITDVSLTINVPLPLRISEINYHPPTTAGVTDPEDLEFVELFNTSAAPINLQGVTISKAFDYTFSASTPLAAHAYIVISRNPTVFRQIYGNGATLAAGTGYSPQNLSNKGEEILLTDALGTTLEDFTYGTKAPWPTAPDGTGPSLEAIDPAADPSNAVNWRVSAASGGSPGSSGLIAPTVAASSFNYLSGQSISFTFSQDMDQSSFAITDLAVQLTSGGSILTPASFSWSATTKTLTFTFASVLADGTYSATLAAGSVSSAAGVPLAAAYSLNFFALSGDANHDGRVDIADLGILATNYGSTSATFATGDFNHDGNVDIADLGILATNYGTVFAV